MFSTLKIPKEGGLKNVVMREETLLFVGKSWISWRAVVSFKAFLSKCICYETKRL
jgi:hypothetical protein